MTNLEIRAARQARKERTAQANRGLLAEIERALAELDVAEVEQPRSMKRWQRNRVLLLELQAKCNKRLGIVPAKE